MAPTTAVPTLFLANSSSSGTSLGGDFKDANGGVYVIRFYDVPASASGTTPTPKLIGSMTEAAPANTEATFFYNTSVAVNAGDSIDATLTDYPNGLSSPPIPTSLPSATIPVVSTNAIQATSVPVSAPLIAQSVPVAVGSVSPQVQAPAPAPSVAFTATPAPAQVQAEKVAGVAHGSKHVHVHGHHVHPGPGSLKTYAWRAASHRHG